MFVQAQAMPATVSHSSHEHSKGTQQGSVAPLSTTSGLDPPTSEIASSMTSSGWAELQLVGASQLTSPLSTVFQLQWRT